jgi:hypothetical protein
MIVTMVVATNTSLLSGREGEQQVLGDALRSGRSEFIAVYGRRRVGKTFLVRQTLAKEGIEPFEMVGLFGGTTAQQQQIFADSFARTFGRGLPVAPPANWRAAFALLRDAIEGQRRRKRKVVLFFDELPWIASHRSGFLPELEHFWNAWCTRRDDIVLVVCGSAASWMIKKIVRARGGLHNRLTRTIRLLPFTLPEVRQYYEDRKLRFTDREIIELFMCLGGIPHYLDHIDRGRSVAQHIDRLCFRPSGALEDEFDRVFASLFNADKKYVDVVRALAGRRGGLSRNDLLTAAKLASGGGATTVLDSLEQGGFTTSSVPWDRSVRDKIHRLTDEFSLFHLSWMTDRAPTSWQQIQGTPRWNAWAGLAFESVCHKHVHALEGALGISGVRTVASPWVHPEAQIDLLIDRADGVISVCEMKFTTEPFTITKRYADALRAKLAVFRRETGTRKALHLVFVTSYGLTNNLHARDLVDRSVTMDRLFDGRS